MENDEVRDDREVWRKVMQAMQRHKIVRQVIDDEMVLDAAEDMADEAQTFAAALAERADCEEAKACAVQAHMRLEEAAAYMKRRLQDDRYDEPKCPGENCPYCSGEACKLCGMESCSHGVEGRHGYGIEAKHYHPDEETDDGD